MKALVQKEIRLLAPAYALALVLAVVPVWLLPMAPGSHAASDAAATTLSLLPFCFGAMMLALSAFGREFGLRTFPLILAQPIERNRIWRTKIAVLAGAMASVFAAWSISCTNYLSVRPWMGSTAGLEIILTIGGTAAVVTFAGGLWTTLLLRQVSAAFWFTILAPGAIIFANDRLGGSNATLVAALALYSIIGFLLARRLFFRFQEAGWTGGVVSLPGWRRQDAASQPALRAHRPLAALFWKELQLQQVSLLAIGLLFLMHLGVVEVRRFGQDSLGDTLRAGLEVFGGVWLIVPLLVGGSSVADERNLGVTLELLCLPISSRIQYALKLLFVLVLGGVLSGLLLWTAEGIGGPVRVSSSIEAFKAPFQVQTLVWATLICLGLSLIGFYASTLTRSIVQALAAAAATAAGFWMAGVLATAISFGNLRTFGIHLWWGYLVFYIALPTLVATVLALAYRNFRHSSWDWRLWRFNLLSLAGALLLIATLTTAAYHRAWELVTPIEPRHDPARLLGPSAASPSGTPPSAGNTLGPNRLSEPTSARPLQLYSYGGSALAALLPDGRLWVDRIGYEPGRIILILGAQTGIRVGGKWQSVSGNQIEPGSNWVAAAANSQLTVAIRADGTLWVSKEPRRGSESDGWLRLEPAARLVRLGQETNWQSVAQCGYAFLPVVLRKWDGTLWCWYPRYQVSTNTYKMELRSEPQRLGTESDWAKIIYARDRVYAWKNDGRAWLIHPPSPGSKPRKEEVSVAPDVVIERSASLDNFQRSSLAECWPWHAAVLDDGTLWAWTDVPPTLAQNGQSYAARAPVQIGNERDWRAVAGGSGTLTALKADGSLWQWQWSYYRQQEFGLPTNAPVRLGTHNDWLGIGDAMNGTVSLAADGSLWYWCNRDPDHYSDCSDQPMLEPSRRPSKIENILDGGKPGHGSQ